MGLKENTVSRIESEHEVKAYIQNLKYAIKHGAKVTFQIRRLVDCDKKFNHTNLFTVNKLFPDENPTDALKRELLKLNAGDYIRTVKDIRFPNKSEMREFGKVYSNLYEVYIKLRVELLDVVGGSFVFVMSFHFSEKKFKEEMFPYRRKCVSDGDANNK